MPGTIPSLPWWQREEERISRWNDSKPTGSEIKNRDRERIKVKIRKRERESVKEKKSEKEKKRQRES